MSVAPLVDDAPMLERVALDPELPDRLYRMIWLAGYGYPRCERRERTARWYTRLDDAARQLAVLAGQPDHHKLVGCWELLGDAYTLAADGLSRPRGFRWQDVTEQVVKLARDRLASDLVGVQLADDEGE